MYFCCEFFAVEYVRNNNYKKRLALPVSRKTGNLTNCARGKQVKLLCVIVYGVELTLFSCIQVFPVPPVAK